MSRGAHGRLLLFVGGLLLVAGFAWPELCVAARDLRNAAHPAAAPQRSHWFVLHENLDMVAEPDETSPTYFTVWYGVQAAGLAWFGLAGGVIALTSLAARGRLLQNLAAMVAGCFHGGALLLIAAGVVFVWWKLPPPEPGHSALVTGGAAALMVALFCGEAWLACRAVARGGAGRLGAVDMANVLPLAFLFVAHTVLWIALHGHPNWPSDGYGIGAIGGALALLGMSRRLSVRGPSA